MHRTISTSIPRSMRTRRYEADLRRKREAIKFATIDSTVALMFALFINAAILIVAAATIYTSGHNDVVMKSRKPTNYSHRSAWRNRCE